MERLCSPNPCQDCSDCPEQLVCRCLKVTEAHLIETIVTRRLITLKQVREHTGAGDGCTCCHARIQGLLEQHTYASDSSALPICSAR
ncbi:MAG: (2Fe-2S)-binding protein [Gemmataceae bacterium]|nr:(2Fe-2S)-binding protein [Gemmataceae bacterium]